MNLYNKYHYTLSLYSRVHKSLIYNIKSFSNVFSLCFVIQKSPYVVFYKTNKNNRGTTNTTSDRQCTKQDLFVTCANQLQVYIVTTSVIILKIHIRLALKLQILFYYILSHKL